MGDVLKLLTVILANFQSVPSVSLTSSTKAEVGVVSCYVVNCSLIVNFVVSLI